MSAQRVVERSFTEKEYLELEEVSPTKHEYCGGEIFAMAGASGAPNDIALAAGGTLKSQLRGRPCRARSTDQRIKVEATGLVTYPDAVVVCPPFRYDAELPNTILDAVVIVEVLSPSTAPYDKGSKFANYKRLSSFRHYLLIDQLAVWVEHHWLDELSGDWMTQQFTDLTDEIYLEAIDCRLSLEDLYEGVDFDS